MRTPMQVGTSIGEQFF
jgi:hypothetical protein